MQHYYQEWPWEDKSVWTAARSRRSFLKDEDCGMRPTDVHIHGGALSQKPPTCWHSLLALPPESLLLPELYCGAHPMLFAREIHPLLWLKQPPWATDKETYSPAQTFLPRPWLVDFSPCITQRHWQPADLKSSLPSLFSPQTCCCPVFCVAPNLNQRSHLQLLCLCHPLLFPELQVLSISILSFSSVMHPKPPSESS